MKTPPIVSTQEWEAALQEMLVKGKELTRARDAVAAMRRRMPWTPVEKSYEFEGPDGTLSLLDLFGGRRQLIVYRAFVDPGVHGWPEHGCVGCSLIRPHWKPGPSQRPQHHPRVRLARLPVRHRAGEGSMGWNHPWYTIVPGAKGAFDLDFGVHEWHGTNAFIRDGDRVFRTYFINNRGDKRSSIPGASST